MKYLTILYLAVSFSIVSCNQEKKRMIKGLSQTYSVDTSICDAHIFKNIGIDSLKLILSENGTYRFTPELSILKGYDGTWDLSNDYEYSNFVFRCKNGVYEENPILFIDIKFKGRDYRICFK